MDTKDVWARLEELNSQAKATKASDAGMYASLIAGKWTIGASAYHPKRMERRFSAPTIEECFAQLEAWLVRDEEAELNLTLGLTPDGRFEGFRSTDGRAET